jgi:AcrR family transcriptional regulator
MTTSALPPPPWERAARRRPTRLPLTREAIVDAALAVLTRDGASAVTMRRVAEELSTGPASLYAHVNDKEELENLVFDRIAGEVPLPTPDAARWREQVKELLQNSMETFSRYPGVATFAFARIPYGPNALASSEALLELLRLGGVDDRVAAFATDLLHQYVLANAYEHSVMPAGGDGFEKAMEHYKQVNAYFKSLPAERFPNVVRLADALFDVGQDRFEFGLDILLTGLTLYASPPPSA